jgi:hypothetical protein
VKRAYALIGTGVVGVLGALGLGAVPMLAQQSAGPEAGGPVLTFGIASTLSATDNYDLSPDNTEESTLFDTRLSMGYRNRRAFDTLSFDLSGVLRAIEPPNGANTFDDRSARLGYQRRGVNSTLSFGADYSFSSVDARDPFDPNRFLLDEDLPEDEEPVFEEDPLDEADLAVDRGNEQLIGARFRVETGLTDPLGFVLSGRYRERSFTDTTDPDLFDSERFDVSGTTRVTLTPVTAARVVLNYRDYSADDAERTNRQTSSVNLGLNQALSQVDTLDVSVGLKSIETEETNGVTRSSSTEEGVVGTLALTRQLTLGTIGTTFDVDQSENGQTMTWQVNRALLLPRGSLSFSIGATRNVNNDIVPTGRINFTHQMLTSSFNASLSQDIRTSDLSNQLRTTRASVGYNYQINSLSSIGISANYVELAQSGGPDLNDTTRTDLRATYNYTLTRDWQLSTGYEYRTRDEETVGEATSNRVFLTLQRSFAVRP